MSDSTPDQSQHALPKLLVSTCLPGNPVRYDGSFTRQSITASGVTTALLQQHGIKVFSQIEIDEALKHLTS